MSKASKLTKIDFDELLERSSLSSSASPRPFIRWAGSKQKILDRFIEILPATYRTYHEAFLGSGAMFFLLRPESAMLNDRCPELIQTYRAIRKNVDAVCQHLGGMRINRTNYYRIRENRSQGKLKHAAEFIYLNKACWNGLYRVNLKGEFNVPYGMPKTPYIADTRNLRKCAAALKKHGVKLRCRDFEAALANVRSGDLVFLDPPYVTTHNNNGFLDYNKRIFSWSDQVRLAKTAHMLAKLGANVIISNANHKDVLELYSSFNQLIIERSSTLAGSSAFRGKVTEVVFYSTTSDRGRF
jgi:DNA adenine methylase